MENPGPPAAVMRDIRDSLTVIKKEMDDSEGYHKWMEYPRKQIEALDLDVLLYLDLTVSALLFHSCLVHFFVCAYAVVDRLSVCMILLPLNFIPFRCLHVRIVLQCRALLQFRQ